MVLTKRQPLSITVIFATSMTPPLIYLLDFYLYQFLPFNLNVIKRKTLHHYLEWNTRIASKILGRNIIFQLCVCVCGIYMNIHMNIT